MTLKPLRLPVTKEVAKLSTSVPLLRALTTIVNGVLTNGSENETQTWRGCGCASRVC